MSMKKVTIVDYLKHCLEACEGHGLDLHDIENNDDPELYSFGIQVTHAISAAQNAEKENLIITLPHVAAGGLELCKNKQFEWGEGLEEFKMNMELFNENLPAMLKSLKKNLPEPEDVQGG